MKPNPATPTSIYQMLNAYEVFATKHAQIHSSMVGPLSELDVDKLDMTQMPVLFIVPGGLNVDVGAADLTLEIIIATEQPADLESRSAVLSNMAYIIKDAIAMGHNHAYNDNEPIPMRAILEMPVQCEPFLARFDNSLIGWTCQLTFNLDNRNDVCLIPIK